MCFRGMVINGACKHKDLAHMRSQLSEGKFEADIQHFTTKSLFALQGPQAAAAIEPYLEGVDLENMLFMESSDAKVAGLDCTVTRCGYTGEDGFEISVENNAAGDLMDTLLGQEQVKPAGLGARDSLRLEAGLCLYGIDLNDDITPNEASLLWTIGKRRREEGGFLGADVILGQIKNKPTIKRAGFMIEGAPARAHVELFAEPGSEEKIGEITSGTFSPTLGKPIAMGYINKKGGKNGTTVYAKVRNKYVPAVVTKMPFVPAHYYRGPGN